MKEDFNQSWKLSSRPVLRITHGSARKRNPKPHPQTIASLPDSEYKECLLQLSTFAVARNY